LQSTLTAAARLIEGKFVGVILIAEISKGSWRLQQEDLPRQLKNDMALCRHKNLLPFVIIVIRANLNVHLPLFTRETTEA